MTIDDLMTLCAGCRGHGETFNGLSKEEFEANGGSRHTSRETCHRCGGLGFIATESGKAVLEFLARMKR